jgi:Pentapeptide repeats (8 copies)
VNLVADCAACVGLCCVAPALSASADFALTKPAGRACVHLSADSRCSIHSSLRSRGFPGCVAYDCFGAGQRTVALLGPGRSPRTLRVYEVLHQLHELLFYLADALARPAAAPVHAELDRQRSVIAGLSSADSLDPADPAVHRAAVAPLLRRASALVRAAVPDRPGTDLTGPDLTGPDHRGADHQGADLTGRDLTGADLHRADLSTAYLLGTALRGADLRTADFLGADLRGADLSGADLTGALYLTRTQIGAAHGDAHTILPAGLDRPAHWLPGGP